MAIVYARVNPSSQQSEHIRVGVVFTAAWQSVDVDAATRTALFSDPFLQASDTDPGGSSGVTINEDNPTKIRTYSALIKRPTAAEFGAGICQIGGVLSVSDGGTWSDVGGVRFRKTPLNIVLYGDSTAATANQRPALNMDRSLLTSTTWPAAGITAVVNATRLRNYLPQYYPQAIEIVNCGIGGQATAAMLARDIAEPSVTRMSTLDIPVNTDVVILRGGSINDIAGGTPATLPGLLTTAIANHKKIISRILARGVFVIDEGIFGFSAPEAGANLPYVRQAVLGFNAAISTYTSGLDNILFVNPIGLTCDSTAAFLPGMSIDGTHLDDSQVVVSKHEAEILEMMYGVSSDNCYFGPNLFSNPLYAAAISGLATGVTTAQSSNVLLVPSIVDIFGKTYQKFVVTPTSALFGVLVDFAFNPSTLGIISGDLLGTELEYIVNPVNGVMPLPTAITVTLDFRGKDASRVSFGVGQTFFNEFLDPVEYIGNIISPKIEVLNNSANFNDATSFWRFTFNAGITSLTPFEIYIGIPKLIKGV